MDGGGNHCCGSGGYTGSNGEGFCKFVTENGLAGYKIGGFGDGAGYFESSTREQANWMVASIGGQGGIVAEKSFTHLIDYSGDGGIAGKGGNIKVSSTAKIYAYNGNRYTDGADEHIYTKDTAKDLQCPIYAQNGVLRAVYKYNSHWGEKIKNGNDNNYLPSGEAINSYSYLHSIMGDTIAITGELEKPSETNPLANVLIRAEQNCAKSGYTNSNTNSVYGIGSGAGYIELSNGTYTVDSSLN